MDWSKSFQFNLPLNFSQFSRSNVTGLHCLSFSCNLSRGSFGKSWIKHRITPQRGFRLTTNDLLLSATLETLKLCYTGTMAIWCLHAETVIQSECTFWLFLCLSLIVGGQGLIQTERYTFYRQCRPALLLSGHHNLWCLLGVSCNQSHATTCFDTCPVWCGGSKHITLSTNHTPLLWKHTHRQSNLTSHELRQTGGLSERD